MFVMRRIAPIALALALVALLAAGCGGSNGSSDDDQGGGSPGAKVFADAGCGDCHTMATAPCTGMSQSNRQNG